LAGLFLTAEFHHERWLGALPPFDRLRSPLGWRHPEAYGFACAAIIYIALVCRDGWLHHLLASPLLRAIGVVSYGLYLVHIDILRALEARGVEQGVVLFGLTLVASYGVACVLYGVVERRFLVTRSAATTRQPSSKRDGSG
jgi:peptidoglycan/LPS O-acetylase OafA/YrhL